MSVEILVKVVGGTKLPRKGICLIWSGADFSFPPSLPCPGVQVSESNLEPSPAV